MKKRGLAGLLALALILALAACGGTEAQEDAAQDQKMALLLGINVDRIISITFIIGSALAALGGLLIATHIGQINSVCNVNGIARLDASNSTAQLRNSVRRGR